jgi:hypothetical protein
MIERGIVAVIGQRGSECTDCRHTNERAGLSQRENEARNLSLQQRPL